MMYEEAILKLRENQQRMERVTTGVAKRFIGNDNHPQVFSAEGWSRMNVDGTDYIRIGDIWCSSQLYKYELQFMTNKVNNYKNFILDITDYVLLESAHVYVELYDVETTSVSLAIEDEFDDVLFTVSRIEQMDINPIVVTPCCINECYVGLPYLNVDKTIQFALQIEYRKLLNGQ